MATEQFTSEREAREHLARRAAEDDEFRAYLMADPKGALQQECGIAVPEDVVFHVHCESASEYHMVLPRSTLTRSELEQIRGGWDGSFADW